MVIVWVSCCDPLKELKSFILGFVGPIGTNLNYIAEDDSISLRVIKIALVSFVGGSAPQIAVEFARRVIPSGSKPSFNELEQALRS